jgi:hypothetical protein
MYLLTAIGLTHDGSSTVHIYTQTIQVGLFKKSYHQAIKNIHEERQLKYSPLK